MIKISFYSFYCKKIIIRIYKIGNAEIKIQNIFFFKFDLYLHIKKIVFITEARIITPSEINKDTNFS